MLVGHRFSWQCQVQLIFFYYWPCAMLQQMSVPASHACWCRIPTATLKKWKLRKNGHPGFVISCRREIFNRKNIWWAFDVVYLGGGFKYFSCSPLIWGRFPIWPLFFRRVGSTMFNQQPVYHCLMISFGASGDGFCSMDDSGLCRGW